MMLRGVLIAVGILCRLGTSASCAQEFRVQEFCVYEFRFVYMNFIRFACNRISYAIELHAK